MRNKEKIPKWILVCALSGAHSMYVDAENTYYRAKAASDRRLAKYPLPNKTTEHFLAITKDYEKHMDVAEKRLEDIKDLVEATKWQK